MLSFFVLQAEESNKFLLSYSKFITQLVRALLTRLHWPLRFWTHHPWPHHPTQLDGSTALSPLCIDQFYGLGETRSEHASFHRLAS